MTKTVFVTVAQEDGSTAQIQVEEAPRIYDKEIGDEFDGGIVGLDGYTLEITGGSDADGFPMRPAIDGEERRRVLVEQGPGVDGNEDGERRRKTVRGNVVSDEIEQLNTKVVESGDREIGEILAEDEEEE